MKFSTYFIRLLFMAASVAIFFSCQTPKLSDAENAYIRGEYFEARKIYNYVYNRTSPKNQKELRAEIAFKMGECNEKLNDVPRAITSFSNAVRYNHSDSTATFHLAKALQADGKYKEAIEQYELFLESNPGGNEAQLAWEGIKGCNLAIDSKNGKASRYIVRQVPILNTNRSEYAPMLDGRDFDKLYFTSTSTQATGEKISGVTGMKNGDILFSRKDENGNWLSPRKPEGDLNTDADEGVVSFSPDGSTMYLTRASIPEGEDATVRIFSSKRSDAVWNEPEIFEIECDKRYVIGHPSVSKDGKWLFFTSDMPGGYGGLDIWKVPLSGKKERPLNLGSQINTPGDECFPTSRNDSVLYFSSDGHPGFGGLDIFRAQLNSTGDFWTIENPGIPLNSKGDDFGITFGEGESGFMSSNRDDSRGRDHIYSFIKPEINIAISGTVLDMDEEPVAGAIIRIAGNNGTIQKQVARDDGSFRFQLERGVRYVMKAGGEGYLNASQEFESGDEEEDAEYEIDFILAAINKPQVVENIFYDFDKATLREESKTALDEMVRILNENPNITIEMGAHTDRKGSEQYNLALSERRAKSVTDYLVRAGIKADRLASKGYGESMPKTVTKKIAREYPRFPEGTILNEEYISTLTPEDQEIADQINRRTEFKVLSTDYDIF